LLATANSTHSTILWWFCYNGGITASGRSRGSHIALTPIFCRNVLRRITNGRRRSIPSSPVVTHPHSILDSLWIESAWKATRSSSTSISRVPFTNFFCNLFRVSFDLFHLLFGFFVTFCGSGFFTFQSGFHGGFVFFFPNSIISGF
jgi:hypothetical protein